MKAVVAIIILAFNVACGVKGDPLPPEQPTEIGRGKPTYQRALRKFKVPEVKPKSEAQESEDENDEEEDKDKE